MKLTPKNWDAHQHYKTRNPPWIKLHKRLLDDFEFQRLPVASRALAPMLWLIASESKDGSFDADPAQIAFRLRSNTKDVAEALSPLIERGFFVCEQDASTMLARQLHDATSEKTETETETPLSASPPKVSRIKPELPEGFTKFWAVYPSRRRNGRGACLKLWTREKLEAVSEQIVLHVEAMKLTPDWVKDGGQYAPNAQTYLSQRRFEDGFPEAPRARLVV